LDITSPIGHQMQRYLFPFVCGIKLRGTFGLSMFQNIALDPDSCNFQDRFVLFLPIWFRKSKKNSFSAFFKTLNSSIGKVCGSALKIGLKEKLSGFIFHGMGNFVSKKKKNLKEEFGKKKLPNCRRFFFKGNDCFLGGEVFAPIFWLFWIFARFFKVWSLKSGGFRPKAKFKGKGKTLSGS